MATDPPFSRMDLVSCRNLLIYLAPPLHKRVIPTFHYALNPLGFLLLGLSETVGGFADLFEWRTLGTGSIGRKRWARVSIRTSAVRAVRPSAWPPTGTNPRPPVRSRIGSVDVDHLLLGQYAPPGVLVNETSRCSSFAAGPARTSSWPRGYRVLNLLRLARDDLLLDLQALFAECRRQDAPAVRRGVRVRVEGRVREIDLRCLPVKSPGDVMRCWLILFEERRSVAAHGPRDIASDAGANPRGPARPWPDPRLPRLVRRLARWLGRSSSPRHPPSRAPPRRRRSRTGSTA